MWKKQLTARLLGPQTSEAEKKLFSSAFPSQDLQAGALSGPVPVSVLPSQSYPLPPVL